MVLLQVPVGKADATHGRAKLSQSEIRDGCAAPHRREYAPGVHWVLSIGDSKQGVAEALGEVGR